VVCGEARDPTFGTFFTGMGASSSAPLALSDAPQQFRNPRNPPDFLGFCIGVDCVLAALALLAFACVAPGEVTDLLLLATLPLRRRSIMLSFDRLLMLSVGSLTVAPLRPVDVGEGCIFWEEDREGTWRRPRFFLDPSGVSLVEYDASSSVGKSV
jgi:hypothetical protein